jgi:2-haloacid dehalogenase
MQARSDIKALTFDLFGTVLDLGGSLTPLIGRLFSDLQIHVDPDAFWQQWRYRQRIEQYQDNIVEMGHGGYQVTARRACVYVLQLFHVQPAPQLVDRLMAAWQGLRSFPDVLPALKRLSGRYRLAALSNGEADFLEHLASNCVGWEFDALISVQTIGAFKPHPGVYRKGAELLGLEVNQCMMVSANSFDVMGARMCGFRGAFVNREDLPYEDTVFQPDLIVPDFTALADALLDAG